MKKFKEFLKKCLPVFNVVYKIVAILLVLIFCATFFIKCFGLACSDAKLTTSSADAVVSSFTLSDIAIPHLRVNGSDNSSSNGSIYSDCFNFGFTFNDNFLYFNGLPSSSSYTGSFKGSYDFDSTWGQIFIRESLCTYQSCAKLSDNYNEFDSYIGYVSETYSLNPFYQKYLPYSYNHNFDSVLDYPLSNGVYLLSPYSYNDVLLNSNFYDNGCFFTVYKEAGFNGNLLSFSLGIEKFLIPVDGVTNIVNVIYFYDDAGNFLRLQFLAAFVDSVSDFDNIYNDYKNSFYRSCFFQSRSYVYSASLTDENIYQQGYIQGINDNQSNVYDEGYENGLQNGKNAGYNLGYQDGVAGAQNYTFNNFFGAIVDAPIHTFSSLFNFELLGVNLSGFVFAMILLFIVLKIVKMVL